VATDNLGREISESISTTDITSEMLGKVEEVVETRSPETESKLDALYDAVNKAAQAFGDSNAESDKNSAQAFAEAAIGIQTKVDKLTDVVRSQQTYLKDAASTVSKLWTASQSQNTLWVGLSKLSGNAQRQIADAIKMAGCCGAGAAQKAAVIGAQSAKKTTEQAVRDGTSTALQQYAQDNGGTTGGGGGSTTGGDGRTGPPSALANLFSVRRAQQVASIFMMMARKLWDMVDLDIWSVVPRGKDLNAYREGVAELIYQTQGFGNANRQLEEGFFDLKNSANAAGVSLEIYGKIFYGNMQRGLAPLSKQDKFMIRQQKTSGKQLKIDSTIVKMRQLQMRRQKSITTTAIHTAKQLGMDASATNETFMNWHLQIGLTALELASVGRHMQAIARSTGITGQRLEKAMQSADGITKALKSAGGASEDSLKNVTELSALFEKFGVAEKGSEIMMALSGAEKFFAADPGLQRFLAMSGRRGGGPEGGPEGFQKVMAGLSMTTRANALDMAKGMRLELGKQMERYTQKFRDFGAIQQDQTIADMDLTQFDKILQKIADNNGEQGIAFKRLVEIQTKAWTGILGPGDVAQILKVIDEFGKTQGQTIKDMIAQQAALKKNGKDLTDEFKE